MNDQKLKDAKSALAHSQALVDQVKGVSAPQEVPQPVPPPATPQAPNTDVQDAVKATMEPYMKEIKDLLSKDVKEVELKIEGEMSPK